MHWKDWCWSSNTLTTWCEELIHWKSPWSWERLRAKGERCNREWNVWLASPTQWTSLRNAQTHEFEQTLQDSEVQGSLACGRQYLGSKSQTWLRDWTTTWGIGREEPSQLELPLPCHSWTPAKEWKSPCCANRRKLQSYLLCLSLQPAVLWQRMQRENAESSCSCFSLVLLREEGTVPG